MLGMKLVAPPLYGMTCEVSGDQQLACARCYFQSCRCTSWWHSAEPPMMVISQQRHAPDGTSNGLHVDALAFYH